MDQSVHQRVYDIVRLIPKGKVATYGQIAHLTGNCTPRMVGYALAALKEDNIPWQRVINSQGRTSPRSGGSGEILQQKILESEGIEFNPSGKTNLSEFGWKPEKGSDVNP
jgi:methylated-DNA-protein-cysteine methyltransferase-like protein